MFEELLEQFDAADNAAKKVNVIKRWTQEQRKAFFMGLTSKQKISVMDSLGDKGKVLLYNAVDVSERKRFLELLTESAKNEFIDDIRSQAVKDFWAEEKILIKQGKGTYNWTIDEQKLILKGKTPYTDLGEVYEGQHMYSAATYPEFAGISDNIQFLTYDDHRKGAHNGNTRLNQTQGYYDESDINIYKLSKSIHNI